MFQFSNNSIVEGYFLNWDFLATKLAPIIQAIAAAIGLVGLALIWFQIRETRNQLAAAKEQIKLNVEQLKLTAEQIQQQTKWQQINCQHILLSDLPSQETESKFWEVVKKYRTEPSWNLPDEACPRLYDDLDSWLTVKTFANSFERLCAAIEANSLDDEYAYSVHGAKVIDVFNTFEHYINYIRRKRGNATIFIELEKVATRWIRKSKIEQESMLAEQAKLRESRGTRGIIR